MALFEEVLEGGIGTPLAIGIGALILGPTLFPAIGRIVRPLAKAAIKTGITLYEETVATVSEATGDIVAEARSELESEARERPAKGRPEARPATTAPATTGARA